VIELKRKLVYKAVVLALTSVMALSAVGCQPSSKAGVIEATTEDIQVKEETLSISEEYIEGSIKIPSIINLADNKVQDRINATLKNDIMDFIDQQKSLSEYYKDTENPSKLLINVSSKVTFKNQDLISMLILKEVSYGEHSAYKVKTAYTFDFNIGRRITLDKLVNGKEDYKETIKNYITENYKEKSDIRKADIMDNQYYLTDGKLNIFFGEYIYDEVNENNEYQIPFDIFKEGVNLQPKLEPYAVEISTKKIKESNEYFDANVRIPVISGLNDNTVQDIINKRFEEEALEFKNRIGSFAIQDHEEALKEERNLNKYSAYITFEEKRNQGDIISIYVVYEQYTGGAHGMYYPVTYNIDLNTGNLIELKDLFTEGTDYVTIISDKIREQIQAINEEEKNILKKLGQEEDFYPMYEEYNGIKEDQLYYLTDDKLGIYFELYEIAPYAWGIPTFEIPLEDLDEYLNPNIKSKL